MACGGGCLKGVDQRELILEDYVGGILSSTLDEFAGEKLHPDQWNVKGLEEKLRGPVRAEPDRRRESSRWS